MAKRSARLAVALAVAAAASPCLARTAHAQAAARDSIYAIDPIVDGSVIVGSTALVISIYLFAAGGVNTRCPCDPQEVNSFDRFAVNYHSTAATWLSNVTVGAALVAPPLLDWFALGNRMPLVEDLTVYAESIAVSAAINVVAKQIAQRPFPRTYQGDPALVNSANGYRSFYSGHTTLTFAALSTASFTYQERWGERYGWTWLPWVVTAAVGTSVAIERVAAGWHFPTDVITGAVAGTAVGIAVPLLHLRRLGIFPLVSATAPGDTVAGVALSGRWP